MGHTDGGGGTLPHVDIADEVTPFSQSHTEQGSSSMRPYDESRYFFVVRCEREDQHRNSLTWCGGIRNRGHLCHLELVCRPRSPWTVQVLWTGTLTRVSFDTTLTREGGHDSWMGFAMQQEATKASGDVVVHQMRVGLRSRNMYY